MRHGEHHNERYTDPGEEGYTGTVEDYSDDWIHPVDEPLLTLRPARNLRAGDRLMGGSTITVVDNVDGWIEAVLDNGKTALYRASSDVPVEVEKAGRAS